MNEEDRAKFDAAIRQFWAALSEMPPPDRLILIGVFVVGVVVGARDGLGLLTPFYALVLVTLAIGLWWVIRELARTK